MYSTIIKQFKHNLKKQVKMEPECSFYTRSADYWAKIPATVDGILGGFGHISEVDIKGSEGFLNQLFSIDQPPQKKYALDCGAGIGRITKNLLVPYFQKVDMVEQDSKFIKAAKELLGKDNPSVGDVYNICLQNFKPKKKYDVVWCQWVLGYLKDYDLIDFLSRCRESLTENGIIICKENITRSPYIEYDEEDSSVTRPLSLLYRIFEESKLKIIATESQPNFPDEIYPVYMFALKPKKTQN